MARPKLASLEESVHVNAFVPKTLKTRLIKQAAKETSESKEGKTITPSQIIRWALEDYLSEWENAVLVDDEPVKDEGD